MEKKKREETEWLKIIRCRWMEETDWIELWNFKEEDGGTRWCRRTSKTCNSTEKDSHWLLWRVLRGRYTADKSIHYHGPDVTNKFSTFVKRAAISNTSKRSNSNNQYPPININIRCTRIIDSCFFQTLPDIQFLSVNIYRSVEVIRWPQI